MAESYEQKKRFYDSLLTVYGRKPVLEVLEDASIPVYRLHLADSNQSGGTLREIENLAARRGIDIRYHSREELSRISKNRRQDQGVAVDLQCPGYQDYRDFLGDRRENESFRLIALDNITNPQNLGMVIRSVSASPMDGIVLPAKGCAPLSPLVIKASAGTLFKCRILRCERLADVLRDFAAAEADICMLSGAASTTIASYRPAGRAVYVLGNETDGVSAEVEKLATRKLRIPMSNGVESLNVAVTAALIAFRDVVAAPCVEH
ncbi:MAG: RNA methyltransferase [Porticoccaceae bacterium]